MDTSNLKEISLGLNLDYQKKATLNNRRQKASLCVIKNFFTMNGRNGEHPNQKIDYIFSRYLNLIK